MSISVISNLTVFKCCLRNLLMYILFEKYINILVLEMSSRGNEHCANCIGTLSSPYCSKRTVLGLRKWDRQTDRKTGRQTDSSFVQCSTPRQEALNIKHCHVSGHLGDGRKIIIYRRAVRS